MSTINKVDLTGGKAAAASAVTEQKPDPALVSAVAGEVAEPKPPKNQTAKPPAFEAGNGTIGDLDSSDVSVPNYSVTIEGLGTVGVMAGSEDEAKEKAFAKLGIVRTGKAVSVGPISD